MIEEYGIKTVVNFWPKIDPDITESGITSYLYLPAVRSEQMLEPRIESAARYVSELCVGGAVLALCEAGMTRSVYFCVLLASLLLEIPLIQAKDVVLGRIGRTSLKPCMLRRIERGWAADAGARLIARP
jgi:hypothetical protein